MVKRYVARVDFTITEKGKSQTHFETFAVIDTSQKDIEQAVYYYTGGESDKRSKDLTFKVNSFECRGEIYCVE